MVTSFCPAKLAMPVNWRPGEATTVEWCGRLHNPTSFPPLLQNESPTSSHPLKTLDLASWGLHSCLSVVYTPLEQGNGGEKRQRGAACWASQRRLMRGPLGQSTAAAMWEVASVHVPTPTHVWKSYTELIISFLVSNRRVKINRIKYCCEERKANKRGLPDAKSRLRTSLTVTSWRCSWLFFILASSAFKVTHRTE